jgi:hypothetical protein
MCEMRDAVRCSANCQGRLACKHAGAPTVTRMETWDCLESLIRYRDWRSRVLDQHTLAGRCYVVTVLLPVRCWDPFVFSFFAIVEVAVRLLFGCYYLVEG